MCNQWTGRDEVLALRNDFLTTKNASNVDLPAYLSFQSNWRNKICRSLCICGLRETDIKESKLKLFIQPIDNSIFERLFGTRIRSAGPPTKCIVQYTEQKHQNYFHNET